MEQIAAGGHEPVLFTSSFPGSAREERINGIRIVRYGGRFTIYPKSILCYNRHVRGKFDAVVESINGVPFFTPLFSKEPVISIIHQLTRQNWYSGLPFPAAFLGYHAEDALLGLYSKRPAVAVSESTCGDLLRLGFSDVHIVYGGTDIRPQPATRKEPGPTLLCLGRMTKSKRVEDALQAFHLVRKSLPDARLWVAGSGPREASARELADKLGLGSSVRFFGRVDEGRKAALFARAHAMLFPAVREGWGLVVLEANACRTPVIGYRVHGVRDSIMDGVNGILVPDGDVRAMADAAVSLLANPERLRALSSSSRRYSAQFTWSRCASSFLSLLESRVKSRRAVP